jgi:hypothetical protein
MSKKWSNIYPERKRIVLSLTLEFFTYEKNNTIYFLLHHHDEVHASSSLAGDI